MVNSSSPFNSHLIHPLSPLHCFFSSLLFSPLFPPPQFLLYLFLFYFWAASNGYFHFGLICRFVKQLYEKLWKVHNFPQPEATSVICFVWPADQSPKCFQFSVCILHKSSELSHLRGWKHHWHFLKNDCLKQTSVMHCEHTYNAPIVLYNHSLKPKHNHL